MLWNREDAEDATQEILVRAVTRLAQFDFRSKLKTWVYRIAVNYILDVKKSPVERLQLTFEQFAEDLAEGLSSDGPTDAERSLLIEEVKIGCTLGMLQCLDRPHRLAYVLGEILELPGPEAADALEITPEVFRKRLQHARAAIMSFTRIYCGLASDAAACACHRRVPAALRAGRVREDRHFASEVRPSRGARESFGKSRRRDGRSRSTEPAVLVPHRSTSRVVWSSHSMCDVSDRPIAVIKGLSPRLSLSAAKTAPPEPTGAKSLDRRSERSGRIYEKNRRCPRGGHHFQVVDSKRPKSPTHSVDRTAVTFLCGGLRLDERAPAQALQVNRWTQLHYTRPVALRRRPE